MRSEKYRRKERLALKAALVFIVFFLGAGCILFLDNLCLTTTGSGGNLLFNVEK